MVVGILEIMTVVGEGLVIYCVFGPTGSSNEICLKQGEKIYVFITFEN